MSADLITSKVKFIVISHIKNAVDKTVALVDAYTTKCSMFITENYELNGLLILMRPMPFSN